MEYPVIYTGIWIILLTVISLSPRGQLFSDPTIDIESMLAGRQNRSVQHPIVLSGGGNIFMGNLKASLGFLVQKLNESSTTPQKLNFETKADGLNRAVSSVSLCFQFLIRNLKNDSNVTDSMLVSTRGR